MAEKLDKKTLNALTDVVLEYNRTPRDQLFEYPYNEFESRDLIANAERAARKMAGILGVK